MYKVFFNEYSISFLLNRDNSVINNSDKNVRINCVGDFFRFLESLEKESLQKDKDVFCSLSEKMFHKIFENFTSLPAAGGVVMNNNDQLLFIKKLGRWDLPKGKMEKGETPEKTALREVSEECGICHHEIVKQLPSTIHLYRSPFIKEDNNWVVKKTFWFEMALNEDECITPQTEEDISAVRWFSCNQLKEVYDSTYRSLKVLVTLYMK
ncbi:MAG: NUDIX domain-containing protein [Prolixibacteraceae bacterium]|nr:NUDIX domain-containing protein [Prolixibacteraceae bacterium]